MADQNLDSGNEPIDKIVYKDGNEPIDKIVYKVRGLLFQAIIIGGIVLAVVGGYSIYSLWRLQAVSWRQDANLNIINNAWNCSVKTLLKDVETCVPLDAAFNVLLNEHQVMRKQLDNLSASP